MCARHFLVFLRVQHGKLSCWLICYGILAYHQWQHLVIHYWCNNPYRKRLMSYPGCLAIFAHIHTGLTEFWIMPYIWYSAELTLPSLYAWYSAIACFKCQRVQSSNQTSCECFRKEGNCRNFATSWFDRPATARASLRPIKLQIFLEPNDWFVVKRLPAACHP